MIEYNEEKNDIKYKEILKEIIKYGNSELKSNLKRFKINIEKSYGVSIKDLRKIAKGIGKDHDLAMKLWDSGIREAKILASMIDDPELVTSEQMETWANDFDSWDVCDECCTNLLAKTRFAYEKAIIWSKSDKEFVKRAGFVLMANIARHRKDIDKDQLLAFINEIKLNKNENRPIVKKAIEWALREIRKREIEYTKRA